MDAQFAVLGARTIKVNARELAERAGTEKAVNVVLLGVYAGQRGEDRACWLQALEAAVPQKHIKTNLAAFELGYAVAALNRTLTDNGHDDLE
jgi:indolepyruvate ferredoxin oxidoreductase beta subunit